MSARLHSPRGSEGSARECVSLSARSPLRHQENQIAAWLEQQGVQVVVLESTAQYWKPVWAGLEQPFHPQLAQAQSNRGPRGRKTDFRDAARLIRGWVCGELILS